MNMKKTIGVCATLLAGLLCAVPQSAQAEGKIRAVDAYDPGNVYAFPNTSEPLKVGDKVRIRFRMVNLGWDATHRDSTVTDPWMFTYTGTLTGNESLDRLLQIAAEKPRLGLWISGELREAECVSQLGVASDWLSEPEYLDGEKHYTDLEFEYTVQAGDLALPILLANAAGTGPADGASAEGYYLKFDGRETPWKIVDSQTMSVTNDFKFGPADLRTDSDFGGDAFVGWWGNASERENRDLDLTQAGVYVQAIDFDSTYDDEETRIWRTIAQGSTTANPGAPTIEIPGGSAKTMDLYLWTADTNIAEIVKGGKVLSVEPYEFADEGVTRKVGRVRIDATYESVPFSVKATGAVGETTQVFLAATPTNIFYKSGDLVTNFIVRTVKVGEPLPPGINVTVNGKAKDTVTANADHDTALVNVNVTLSEAWNGSEALTIPIKVTVMENPALDARDYVRMSQAAIDDNLAWNDELTVNPGSTTATQPLWMYANRGTADTENGLLVEVDTNRLFQVEAARNFFTGKIIAGTVVVNRSTPEITSALPPITDAEANSPKEITINVADAYGELHDPCRYTVYWSRSGGVSASDYVVIPDLAATAAGDLTFSVTYLQKGDYNSRFYVVNQDGKKSDPLNPNASVSVTVKAQKVIEATTLQKKFPEDAFNEQEVVTLTFGGEEFSMPNGETEGYIFFVPRNANASNLVDCADLNIDEDNRWMAGYPVYAGETEVGPFLMTLLDGDAKGITMGYDIVVRTAEHWDEGDIVASWNSKGFSFGVTNVVPQVTQVSMSGTRLSVNGGTMTARASLNVSKTFTAQTTEPADLDLYADDPDYTDEQKAFTTEWSFDYGNGAPDVKYVYGPPSTALSYAFTQAGTCTVTVRMCDKDMDHNRGVYGPEFTFKVNVDAKPSISLSPFSGLNMFYETAIGQNYGKINVALSMVPTAEINVHLDVTRAGADDVNYPLPVLNSYDIVFNGSKTNDFVWFTALDGTALGESQGYNISAVVTTTSVNADGVSWSNLYTSAVLPVTIVNNDPEIMTRAGTNEIWKAENENFRIEYTVRDVPADVTSGLSVTWQTSEGFSTNYTITATSLGGAYTTYKGSSPIFSFTSAGSKTVTLLLEDKDGGFDQQQWKYYVVPSKALLLYPRQPDQLRGRGGNLSAFSANYTRADGLGDGRVWAEGSVVDFKNFIHKYTFDPTVAAVDIYARGYKVGDVDNGSLQPGPDITIDASGNHYKSGGYSTYYTSQELSGLDSYFYCWILDTKGEGGGGYTGSLLNGTLNPAVEAKGQHIANGHQRVSLAEYEEDAEAYDPTEVEAIFSKERYPADNVGDINKDGIPDVFAVGKAYDRGLLYQFATGGAEGGEGENATASDIKPKLTTFNDDGDYLPSATITGGGIPTTADGWSNVGQPFKAEWEIRGFHSGLNYRVASDGLNYNVRGAWVSDPSFSPAESNAIVYMNKKLNVHEFTWPMPDVTNETEYAAAVANWNEGLNKVNSWIPENRTDPTVADTDGDGFPDGFEYYFWYRATVGWIDAKGEWKRLEGEKFQLEDIAKGVPISSDDIAVAFNPTVPAAGSEDDLAGRDTDNDGLTDLEELALGTNPVHWDTDGDGMSDLWEIMRGKNPLKAPDPAKRETNLDGDYMASFTTEKEYTVLTFTTVDNTTLSFAVKGDVSSYLDDNGEFSDGVSNLNAIAVYRYGDERTDYTPVSRGAYGSDTSISYLGRAGKKYAGRVEGDIRIATAKPLDMADVDVSEMTFVSFETNKALRLVHDQVYAQFGFDPRTAWGMNVNGYVCNRWDPNLNPNYASNVGEAGLAVNTSPYSDLDEYLVLKYRYNAKSADGGKAIRSLSDDLSKIAADQLTIAGVLAAGTTNPNVPFEQVDYTVTDATSSGDDQSETSQQGAAIPTYTSTNHGADTDEDGVPDGWELYVMFDPNDKLDRIVEEDGDGMPLGAEYAGTDSCNAYEHATNGLGKVTIYEQHPGNQSGWFNKFFPTDPWDIDTDGDGISDRAEGTSWGATFKFGDYSTPHTFTFIYGEPTDDDRRVLCIRGGGLNPCTVDTDGDLLPDPWEYDFAGVVFKGGSPDSFSLPSGVQTAINRNDGVVGGGDAYYITAGMDGTFGPRNGLASSIVSDAATGTVDPRTGTVRNFDFDNDGLQNFQEYLVQTLRHLRYDDTETPLMGSYLPDGLAGTRTYVGFLPMQTWDGAAFFKTARAAGFTGLSAYGGEGFRYRDLGYFIRPPKPWDVVAQDQAGILSCANYDEPGYRVMLRPAGLSKGATAEGEDRLPADSYATTDPRMWDSDGDGMDDYYEIFHGLNPLLGKTDVISDAYSVIVDGLRFSAYYNAWVNWPAMPPMMDPIYDAMKYPWFMGTAEADADGDGLRNTEEALLVNTPSPQNYHTDPTPLWMTDSSAKTSFTAQYYGRDPIVTAAMGIPDLTQYFWFGSIVDRLSPEGSVSDYMFSFEENEGFDTDHDWLPDGQELTHVVTSATDPRNGYDPDRRQAMYLPGTNSAVASYSGAFSRPVGENYAMLRKFTVEAWVRPDGAAEEQTILARLSDYPNSTLSNALHQVRANFRIALDAEGRVFGQFDSSDAVVSGSPNGFGTVTVRGSVLDAEVWSHVALSYNGSALVLYVNGREVNRVGSNLIPANGIVLTEQSVTPAGANFGESGYKTYPGVFLVGADAANVAAAVLNKYSSWANYRAFYRGWVDEVRVWDGDRTANQIAEDYEKRYSFADAAALREEIYAAWLRGATRNENDGKPDLPAELLLHYTFQQLPSEVNPDYMASEPSGFTEKVVDNVKWNEHTVDLRCGWWSAIPIASDVYANRALVPWIRNMCGMLPAMDGSTPDSRYWSELLGGVTIPQEVNVSSFMFPNTSCPYPYWNYMAEGPYRQIVLDRLRGTVSGNHYTNVVDLANRFAFDYRTGFVGGADLLPLGGAFAKRCPDFWDGQGATDATTATADDLDNDGLPDWWEDYAAAQYGVDLSALTASTMVDYILPSGESVRMPAWQAYQIDLARGMLPELAVAWLADPAIEVYDDAYSTLGVDDNGDGIPDWWQKMFGVFDSDAAADPDGDGLSNYQEWLITWGDDYGYGLSNGFPYLDPTKMCSQSEEGINIVDYFAQSENPDYDGYYMGEIFTDHDFMEDLWEDAYSMDAVSRHRYDAHLDPDGDGWSNFAEMRSLTAPDKTATLSLVRADGSEDHALPAYPIPTVRATVANSSGEAFESAIVVKAWKGSALSGTADATWTVPGEGGASKWNSRFLGLAPNRKMKFNIGPGDISQGHVMLEFYDPLYEIEHRYYETNGTLKKVTWTPHNVDNADWGVIYYGDTPEDDSHGRGTGAIPDDGWVNYANGDIEVDFAGPTFRNTDAARSFVVGDTQTDIYHYNLTRAFWRIRWMARIVDVGSVKKFSLCAADEGFLREGKNTFVAFADLNGNGELDVGEPSGFARDVNVGFDCVNVEIALSSDAVAFDLPAQEGDETAAKSLVRVARTAINGVRTRPRIVYSRAINLAKGKTFTEADFVKSGEYDLDWNRLVKDADAFLGVTADKISSVNYEVYVGEESTNSLATFTRNFAGLPSAPRPTGACTNAGYVVASAQPVLKWKAGVGFSAFALQIAKDEDFSNSNIVYATTNFMPAAMADGCTFKPDVYVGDGLADNTTYYWRVAQLNAKFRENAWSETASFRTAVDSSIAETGYGSLVAEVRYFGPAWVALSNVVVGVYETADFTSAPVARKRLTGSICDSTATLTGDSSRPFFEVTPNVTFDGIAPGSYYVMAFIDTNGNGVRDLWESWGYACGIGTDVTDRWSPVSFGVSASKVAPSAALVVMEDTDVNQNWMPDCLEDISSWTSPTGDGEDVDDDVDSDGDGLPDNQEGENGTPVDSWDLDGDGMPDGWEVLFAETDPVTPDGDYVVPGDVMAYVVTNLMVITTYDGTNVTSATNKYIVTDFSVNASIGGNASTIPNLYSVYDYGGKYGFGKPATAVGTVFKVERSAEVVLVHAQVYDAFGFNPNTANATAFAAGNAVNTKEFTALDKYLLCRYLENVYGLADEVAMNKDRTWSSFTLPPGYSDTDMDGVPDGWELYVMFGPEAVPATFSDARISPFKAADARALAPAGNITLLEKWNSGTPAYNPWVADSTGNGISDENEIRYVLETPYNDNDNDQLPNFTEFVIGVGFTNYFDNVGGISATDSYSLTSLIPDYFRRVGRLYLGEMFTDHDFMEDLWEDLFDASKITRGYYDPWRDADDDGWSNFAECRAGTDPTRSEPSDIKGVAVHNYPVPTVHATVVMGPEEGVLNGTLVVQAFSQTRTSEGGSPDATWTVTTGTNSVSGQNTSYFGVNPNCEVTFWLSPGTVKYGTVSVDFLDPAFEKVEGGVTSYGNLSTAEWQTELIEDRPLTNDTSNSKGELVAKPTNKPSYTVGSIDYSTGRVTIDFTKLPKVWRVDEGASVDDTSTSLTYTLMHLDTSHVRATWEAAAVGGDKRTTLLLRESDPAASQLARGHLREGRNMFVAFLDLDGSGSWNPGEPYGVVRDVDVGWSDAEFTVELTRTTPIMARFALASGGNFDANGSTDRDVANNGNGYLSNESAMYSGTNFPDNISSLTRVRVVRNWINHESENASGSYSAVLLDRYFNLSVHSTLTEADLLSDGEYDLDWGKLNKAYNGSNTPSSTLSNATYRVVIGDGDVGAYEKLGNNLPVLFSNLFEQRGSQTPTVPDPLLDTIVYSSRPTFRWSHTNSVNKAYPAFCLRIYTDASKSDASMIYDSGVLRAPARNSDGMYEWTAPIYAGMATSNGKVFTTTNNYYWAVSMLDAKFYRFSSNEVATQFRFGTSGNLLDGKGFGAIAVRVKYFGPLVGSFSITPAVARNLIRVQAFTSPDFSGPPVAETYVTDVSSIASESVIITNAVISGVAPGNYYVRAYIDTDGDASKSQWESWGYACSVLDTKAVSVYRPMPITVSYSDMLPTVTLFMEDADTDGDGFPDAWEVAQYGNLTTQGPISGNTFFAAVNPQLAASLAAYDKVDQSLRGVVASPYPQFLRMMSASPVAAAQLLLDSPEAAEETTSVRIKSFTLEDGLELEVTNESVADAAGLITFTGTADVGVYLVCASTPDFADAKEVFIKTISISSNATVKKAVTAEELDAARAQAPEARFFKAVIK